MKNNYQNTIYLLSVLGLIDSLYLTWIKISHNQSICAGFGECDLVNSSQYSEVLGIPISLFGLGAYLIIIILTALESRTDFFFENTKLIIFGLTLSGLLYSTYLTYIEVAVLNAICPFCVISAIIMLVLFIISALRLNQHLYSM